jgi:hypothetical protein
MGQAIYNATNIGSFLDKRVEPEACQYELIGGTIFDIFHEMSLRHPGWVYGPRPYGNRYRYTMFFGLPAQRYWAKPASPGFIDRANKLYEFLRNGENEVGGYITNREFIDLYGKQAHTDLMTKVNADLDQLWYKQQADLEEARERRSHHPRALHAREPNERNVRGRPGSGPGQKALLQGARMSFISQRLSPVLHKAMESRALREYLQAMEIRFQPFRRYHFIDSKRDLVWNGIMGSEQAVINAVDITYQGLSGNSAWDADSSLSTALFKTHTFIPENLLRIAPVTHLNCKGWSMAQRYGVGELVHRIKDMYRGEIITVGNSRIRPWDVCILADEYNDIVGPIEVEQVVHTFSHETGFLTEIKPSAVAFANEISGWPVVEAMKLLALAMADVYDNWGGGGIRGAEDVEDTKNALDLLNNLERDMLTYGPSTPTKVIYATLFAALPSLFVKTNSLTALAFAGLGLMTERSHALTGDELAKTAVANDRGASDILTYKTAHWLADEKNKRAIAAGMAKFSTYEVSRYASLFGSAGVNKSKHVFAGDVDIPDTAGLDHTIQDILESIVNTSQDVGGLALALGGAGLTYTLGKGAVGAFKDMFDILGPRAGNLISRPKLFGAGLLIGGGAIARYGLPAMMGKIKFPGLVFLLGGYVLFLQCLRNDAIVLVPLLRNGSPIVAGIAFSDPAMLWRNMKGVLTKMVSETIDGTTGLMQLWQEYGYAAWNTYEQGIVPGRVVANN